MTDRSDLEARLDGPDRIAPPDEFVQQANVTDPNIYHEFEQNWPEVWERAADLLDWDSEWDDVLVAEDAPFYEWFVGGELNASYNCVDRHVENGRKNQAALKWEGKLSETRTYTYQDLYREVNEFAAALRELGVEEGDIVTLYMPVVPELPIAMLACARIGAPHSVVFAGLSGKALGTRIERSASEFLVTCDGYYRRGNAFNLKSKADDALLKVDHDVTSVVVDRLGDALPHVVDGDSRDYHDLLAEHAGAVVEPVARDAEDLLFLMYTSGTTGEPKGVEHATGGYLAQVAWTAQSVLDLTPEDTYWCSADIGWITGHSYIVYGPLALGTTTMLYEGSPDYPDRDRIWEIVERNAVDVFYTAPTAIRAFMKWGAEYPERHDLSSLRLLGTVGEPINPRAWKWYYEHVGGGECPIVDTWWQTETGGMMVTTLPGVDDMKPGSAGPPLPGIDTEVVDAAGAPVEDDAAGYLSITRPWPGMVRTLHGDDERFIEEYWTHPDEAPTSDQSDGGWRYDAGDGAMIDEDGYVTVLGRIDDVLSVDGHRLGTMEVESSIVDVEGVAEAAVVVGAGAGGSDVFAYVSTESGRTGDQDLREQIVGNVERDVGEFAAPARIVFTTELPKTRSGKIMRRLLESIARGEPLGDTSALRNPEIVGELKEAARED
ncbi:acetyl-coenzyme A synthetase [Natronoarchaeum philippinense]|uniref:Acetate--CoA ligase n=1 Tax=Natronoarchaeum philippinense TaxID=558529 RepID=A0A285N1D9_NATPI|nr:acetate--CoA ligase [Natronoarchaeum philippinense]SNZ03284.1 acetyl-coenzyme A synthetase [Natronoarchaeum philippinense]